MTNFTLATPSQNQIWSNKFISEYVRASTYDKFMSTSGDNIITVKNELSSKAGDFIHTPLFAKARGAINDGTTQLVGNEMGLNNYSVGFRTTLKRNAINIQVPETIKTELDLRSIADSALKKYAAETLKNDLIGAFNSMPVANATPGLEDTTVPFATSGTAANNFLTANVDRVFVTGGTNTGTMTSTLASVGATSGKLTADLLSQIKDMADGTANAASGFAIEPYMTKYGEPYFILFVNSAGYRQLRSDTTLLAAMRDALPREKASDENPLWTGGDMVWDNILIKKVRDYGNLGAVGTSGATVAQAHFCGVNSVFMGYSMKTKGTLRKEDDYQLNQGVGFMEYRGQIKASVNGLQTGMLTVLHAS